MALNFQGIGFSFAAKDNGLLAYQKQVLSGFNAINAQVAQMNKGGGMKPPGGGTGGGAPGGGAPAGASMAMPVIPDPTKKAGAWAAFGTTVKKTMGGIFTSTRTTTKELGGMADVGHKLRAILGQLRLGNLLEGLSLANLNQISDTVEKLGSAGRNLTTGLEAEFVSMGKTSKATFANMGYGADQIKKLSGQAAGMAKGMNIDVGKATESIYALAFAEEEFAAIGVKSAKDIAKFSEVTGTDMKATAMALKTMSDGYGISNEALKQLTSSTLAFGQESGDVGAAVGKLPALMDQLSKTTDRYGNVLRGADLAAFAQESIALSAGFYSIYKDAGKAEAATAAITQALAAGRAGYSDLFTGVQSDMPQIITDLSIVGGDFSKAFEMLQSGPESFAAGMVEMSQEVGRTGGDVKKFAATMQSRMKASLGEEATVALTDMMVQSGAGLKDVMKKSHEATVTISEIGKAGFSSGRTLAESMQLAEDSMEMRFRKIGIGSTRTFVTEAQKNFKNFGDQMEHLAGAGGPMAAIVSKLSEISSQGATAFLPDSLKPAAALFGNLLSTMGPALGIIGSLGFRFSMLASPLTLLAAPLGLLAILFGDLVMQSYDAKTGLYNVEGAFWVLKDTVKEFFLSIPGYIDTAIGYLQKFGDWLVEATDPSTLDLSGGGFFATFLQMFEDMGTGGKLAKLGSTLFTVLKNVLSIAFTLIQSIPFADIATGLGKLLMGGLNLAFDLLRAIPVGKIVKILSDVLTSGFNLLSSLPVGAITANLIEFAGRVFGAVADMPIRTMAGQFLAYLGRVLASVVSGIGQLADILGPILSDVFTNAITWVSGPGLAMGETIVADLAAGAVKVGGKLGDALTSIASTAGDALGKNIGPIFDKIFGAALNLTDAAMTLVMNLAKSVGAALPALIPNIVSGMKDLVLAVGPALGSLADTLKTSIGPKLTVGIKDLVAGFIKGLLPALVIALINLPAMLWSILSGLGSVLSGIVTLLGGVALGLFMGVFEGLFGIFGLNFEQLALTFANWLDSLGTMFSTAWAAITTFFVGGWETVKTGVMAAFDGLTTWFSGWWESLKTLFFGFVTPLGEVFTGVTDKVMGFFGGVSDKVQELWGNSMSTDVVADMAISEAAISNFSDQFKAKFDTVGAVATEVLNAVVDTMFTTFVGRVESTVAPGLAAAFQSGYARIGPESKVFQDAYTKGFQTFVTGLQSIWYKGIEDMLLAMDTMVVAVQLDSASLNAEVTRMTQALIAVQEEKQKTLEMTAAAAPITNVPGMEDLPENFKVLAQMLNEPAWYGRYEILFSRKMDELRVDVQKLAQGGAVAASGPRGPSASGAAAVTVRTFGRPDGGRK